MKNKPTTVLLFLKAPRPGFVKTRLAKSIGDDQACAVYRLLVKRTLSQIPPDWSLRIHFAPAEAQQEMIDWLGPDPHYLPQPEGDLGHRLETACDQAFNDKPSHGIILLGGDCPALTTAHLQECATHLAEKKPVIGPSEDGGYWLLGLHQPHPELFRNVAWSTPDVLPTTLHRFSEKSENPHCLQTLADVDDLDSWQEAQNLLDLDLNNL